MEIGGWSPGMVILDAMEKAACVRVLQAELNDQPGVCLKMIGPVGDVREAAEAARVIAGRMRVAVIVDVISGPASEGRPAWEAAADFNLLFEQATVHIPPAPAKRKESKVSQQASFAVGLIETQGFTAVFEAIDTAVKTAAVEVLAREKLGGGYITVLIKGDVAAVTAAIEAGKARVEGLGKLVAAHVIASPSQAVLSLVPKL
ncbi:MAG: BMC domain-containing protein [Acidobacteria bacterium]|nr:BMC domain-containing protein [Acidobacteriota bacterium]